MREIITDKAPAAVGPYSQGVRAGNIIFTSGQLPIDPVGGQIPASAADQARQSLANALAVLQQAGATAQDVVKATIFIKDMNDFAAVNSVYESFFTAPYPARSCVEVARLPKDVLIEIELTGIIQK